MPSVFLAHVKTQVLVYFHQEKNKRETDINDLLFVSRESRHSERE